LKKGIIRLQMDPSQNSQPSIGQSLSIKIAKFDFCFLNNHFVPNFRIEINISARCFIPKRTNKNDKTNFLGSF